MDLVALAEAPAPGALYMQVTFSYGRPMAASVPDLLRAAGLRRTPARIAVLASLEAQARPVSHAELSALPTLAGVDDVTLYRTLAALDEAGLVHRVQGLDGAWRFCVQPQGRGGCPGNHPHFQCLGCGTMTCLVDQPLPRVDVPTGAAVEGRQLVVWGRCASCGAEPMRADP